MPTDMKDDDIFLVFHSSDTVPGRYHAIRYPWYRLKQYFMPGPKGDKGDKGDQGIQGVGTPGPKGDPGKPKRVERYTGVTNSSGVATITFPTPFTNIYDIDVITTWSGNQMVSDGVVTQSTSGCTIKVMISRGALLLTEGPFQAAGSGISTTVRVIGD